MSVFNARQRATTGAAFLDAHYPGWDAKIDLGTLDVGCCSSCMIAQVYGGDYNKVAPDLLTAHDVSMTQLGFYIRGSKERQAERDEKYHQLTEAWTDLILERRAAVPLLKAA